MKSPVEIAEELALPILHRPYKGRRKVIAIAGPPASGKSTLSFEISKLLTERGCKTQVVPMDGFHLDNSILEERNLLDRKGAPETFDPAGLYRLISSLTYSDKEEFFPTFDRDRDLAIAGSGVVCADCEIVVVEGNYLLLKDRTWKKLHDYWDFSISLQVSKKVLSERLCERWIAQGYSDVQAKSRVEGNDLKNAAFFWSHSKKADIEVCG